MAKHIIEKEAPKNYRIPENYPDVRHKYHCLLMDPPWQRNQQGARRGAARHYQLMDYTDIKNLPVDELAADDCHLWLWVTNSNIDQGLELIKTWNFRYISIFTWLKPRLGLGNYLRNSTENCLFAVRGKQPAKVHTQINWLISYPTIHSEKPREFTSIVERVSPGPYLELFCRRRPASTEPWDCWGNETEGGADIFIPDYPVPKYSFEKDDHLAGNSLDGEELKSKTEDKEDSHGHV